MVHEPAPGASKSSSETTSDVATSALPTIACSFVRATLHRSLPPNVSVTRPATNTSRDRCAPPMDLARARSGRHDGRGDRPRQREEQDVLGRALSISPARPTNLREAQAIRTQCRRPSNIPLLARGGFVAGTAVVAFGRWFAAFRWLLWGGRHLCCEVSSVFGSAPSVVRPRKGCLCRCELVGSRWSYSHLQDWLVRRRARSQRQQRFMSPAAGPIAAMRACRRQARVHR